VYVCIHTCIRIYHAPITSKLNHDHNSTLPMFGPDRSKLAGLPFLSVAQPAAAIRPNPVPLLPSWWPHGPARPAANSLSTPRVQHMHGTQASAACFHSRTRHAEAAAVRSPFTYGRKMPSPPRILPRCMALGNVPSWDPLDSLGQGKGKERSRRSRSLRRLLQLPVLLFCFSRIPPASDAVYPVSLRIPFRSQQRCLLPPYRATPLLSVRA
jgi:hypothetical protein